VERGDPLFRLHANDVTALAQAKERLEKAIVISDEKKSALPRVREVISA
jgi:thymidine phosphorylase